MYIRKIGSTLNEERRIASFVYTAPATGNWRLVLCVNHLLCFKGTTVIICVLA